MSLVRATSLPCRERRPARFRFRRSMKPRSRCRATQGLPTAWTFARSAFPCRARPGHCRSVCSFALRQGPTVIFWRSQKPSRRPWDRPARNGLRGLADRTTTFRCDRSGCGASRPGRCGLSPRAETSTDAPSTARSATPHDVAAADRRSHGLAPDRWAGTPLAPGRNAKGAPSCGFVARCAGVIVNWAEVTQGAARSGPPRQQPVGQVQGSSTTASIVPSGAVQVRQAPPATRAVRSLPSASRQDPSGRPRANPCCRIVCPCSRPSAPIRQEWILLTSASAVSNRSGAGKASVLVMEKG